MNCLLLLAALATFAATPAFAQQIYKWTEADGRVHYGDTHNGDAAAMSPIDINAENIAAPFDAPDPPLRKVRIFSADWCGICKRAKASLDHRGTRYIEYDVDNDPRRRDEFRRLGGRGVPLILVGEQRMQGFNPARLERMLIDAGL